MPATCPYPEPALSSPYHPLHLTFWISILILSSHLRLGLPSSLFPSDFLTETLYMILISPIPHTCPAHLNFIDFITRTILGEAYRWVCLILWREQLIQWLSGRRSYVLPTCIYGAHSYPFLIRSSQPNSEITIKFSLSRFSIMIRSSKGKGKGKRKILPRTGHEGSKVEQIYSSTLPLTSARYEGGCSTPCLGRFTPRKDPAPIV